MYPAHNEEYGIVPTRSTPKDLSQIRREICDEETWYILRKNQVLFLLRTFLAGTNEVSLAE